MKYFIRRARGEDGSLGYTVAWRLVSGRFYRVLIAPGEPNWWPTRELAEKYKRECEKR